MPAIATSLLVMRGDEVAFSATHGAGPNPLFYTFSCSKPVVALAIHLLAQQGALALDDPVALHWPEYECRGKGQVTIRQLLTHRGGVPTSTRGIVGDLALMHDWDRSVEAAARARLRYPPGSRVHYHTLSFGFVLGEVVQRVAGVPLTEFLRIELFEPLGMSDTYLQTPSRRLADLVPLVSVGGLERLRRVTFNADRVRRALIPAASMASTTQDQARLYRMLLRGGLTESGHRLFTPATIAALCELSSDGEYDHGMLHTARWGTGVQLGYPGMVRIFGTLANATTFGHNGANICNVWADPERDLLLVYLSNLTQKRLRARRVLCEISDEAIRRYG